MVKMESEKVSEILVNGIQKNLEEVGDKAWDLAWAVYYGVDYKKTALKLIGPLDEALAQINKVNPQKALELKTIVGEDLVGDLAQAIQEVTEAFLHMMLEDAKKA